MLPRSVQNLIDEFSKLPGVGPKTAARLVFYLLSKPKDDIAGLGDAILGLTEKLHFCDQCFNIAEENQCLICQDGRRNKEIVIVVEEPLDVIALEKSVGINGVYHVLGGSISPIDGIGPEQLRINQLLHRLEENKKVSEVVLATNPDLEGEATASYIKEKIKGLNLSLTITRIARGIPMGGDLEYADEVTLRKSLEGRREY